MRDLVWIALCSALWMSGASAQQSEKLAVPTTGDFLAQGYDIKGIINNTYLILQKGDRAFLCGTPENLTWTNWAEVTRDAPCKSLTKAKQL